MEPDHGATSRAWTWRHAVGKSGLPPTTRLVLHTLGLKMDATGGSCYPPISEIVELSGLDKKTVLKHLELAEEKGWIEVSQHGFRGQKWKRNEYVARWPGRDITGEAARTDDGEGGGAVPPPSAEKVVELVPEGGGNGSRKVVEQLHQDKNLPTNFPTNSPSAGAGEREKSGRKDWKKVDIAFWALVKDWPNFDTSDKERPRKLWHALSEEDRTLATERFRLWRKTFGERKNIPMPSTYLGEKLWNTVTQPAPEAERQMLNNAYSKAWSARRFLELLAEPARPPSPTTFQQAQLRQGGAAAEAVNRERRLAYGWPKVMTMHRRAEMAEGVTVAPWLVRLSEGFVGVHKDSEQAASWKVYHAAQGWPWMPVPAKGVDWLYFPSGEPEQAMCDFAEMVAKERGNDDAA